MATRQRRTVRSGQERCYLRCHSYLGLIFLFSYHLAFVSYSIQSLPITQVCTISKETKKKFNPVTKCEKVREVPCQALETGTETFKRNETNKIYCFFRSLKNYAAPLAVVLFRALRFATMRFDQYPFPILRPP